MSSLSSTSIVASAARRREAAVRESQLVGQLGTVSLPLNLVSQRQ